MNCTIENNFVWFVCRTLKFMSVLVIIPRTAKYSGAQGTSSPPNNSFQDPCRAFLLPDTNPCHYKGEIHRNFVHFFVNSCLCHTKLCIKHCRKTNQHFLPVQFFIILWIIGTFPTQTRGTEISSPRRRKNFAVWVLQ